MRAHGASRGGLMIASLQYTAHPSFSPVVSVVCFDWGADP